MLRDCVWNAFVSTLSKRFATLLRVRFCETIAIFSRVCSLSRRGISKDQRPFRRRVVPLPFATAFNFFAHVPLTISSLLFLLATRLFLSRPFDLARRLLRFTKHKAVEATCSTRQFVPKASAQRRSQPANFTSNKWLWSAATVNLYEISWSMEII